MWHETSLAAHSHVHMPRGKAGGACAHSIHFCFCFLFFCSVSASQLASQQRSRACSAHWQGCHHELSRRARRRSGVFRHPGSTASVGDGRRRWSQRPLQQLPSSYLHLPAAAKGCAGSPLQAAIHICPDKCTPEARRAACLAAQRVRGMSCHDTARRFAARVLSLHRRKVQQVAHIVRESKHLIAFTGAGISTS